MKSLCEKYGFTAAGREERLQLINFDRQDHAFAKQLHEQVIVPHLDSIIHDFYIFMLSEKQTLKILKGHDVNLLRKTQRKYLETLGQNFDSATYFEQRLHIGIIHALIELPLSLYQCSYFHLQDLILQSIDKTEDLDPQQRFNLIKFTLKIIALDISLATDTYFSMNLESLEDSIEHLRSEKEVLSTKVNFDMLTGINSRESIMEQAESALIDSQQNNGRFSLLVADIDFFKIVNDTHGHATGDEVLKNITARMDNVVRGDDMVGRIGGEEFLIILPGSGIEAASAVGERIRKAIEGSPIQFQDISLEITISLGAAELEKDETLEHLIGRADQALYKAKEAGRNKICLAEKTEN